MIWLSMNNSPFNSESHMDINDTFTVITHSEAETIALGERFGKCLSANTVIALDAPLASGKTYFTKGIARGLDIAEDVTSPTFTIVSEYEGRLHLYHIDAYRLSDAEDFYDIGADDMMFGGGVCVIEWANIVSAALPTSTIHITITVNPDSSRTFTFCGVSPFL